MSSSRDVVGVGMLCAGLLPAPLVVAAEMHASSVTVEGTRASDYDSSTSSVTKLTEPLLNVPQTVTTVTRQELDDRAVTTMNDALRTVPGITLGAGETSWQGTNLFLRGFTTRNDMFRDGMRDYGYYYRDPFNDAGIEVLKGPASILFGRGSTGGIIEETTKPVTLERRFQLGTQFGTDETRRGAIDVGGPLEALGDSTAFRFNGMVHHSEAADRDAVKSFRWGVAPSLAWGLGTATRLTISYFHQSDDILPDYGIPWFAGHPAPVSRSNFYGFDSDYLDTRVDMGTVRFEHDFDANLTVRSQTRYSHATRRFRTSEPAIPAGTDPNTPLHDIAVSRLVFEGYSTDEFAQNQTDLLARFDTGGIGHVLVAGFEVGREQPEPVYLFTSGIPATNLAEPVSQPYSAASTYVRLAAQTSTNSVGLYALDTVTLADQWQMILGARWDHFDTRYHSTGFTASGAIAADTDLHRTDAAPSYRAALVYKPAAAGTIYVGYASSFNPSAEGIESLVSSGRSVAQANLQLDPEKSRTYELGTKWALAGGTLRVSGSVFQIEKQNARVPSATVPGFNALGGDQRARGLEVELVGQLTPVWGARAGYSYLDTEVTRTAPGGPLLGAPLPLAPKNTASIWTHYELSNALSIGVGALTVSSRLGQNTAASYLTAPGYTTVDAMMKFRVGSSMGVQFNVQNLTDRKYADQLHPFHVIPGAGRSAQLSMMWSR